MAVGHDRSLRAMVDVDRGPREPGGLRQRGDLPAGARADLHARLALRRPREHGPQPGRLRRVAHGRRRSDHGARPEEQDPRVPQYLSPPGHEGLPLRPGQRARVHVPLPRLDLRHRGQARRDGVRQGGLRTPTSTRARGACTRSPRSATTTGRSGRRGTRRPLPSRTTWARSRRASATVSRARTARTPASKCSCRSCAGGFPPTGSFPRSASRATVPMAR